MPIRKSFDWAVGLFEGEGSICITGANNSRSKSRAMVMGMQDGETVYEFYLAIGKIGKIYSGERNGKPWHSWTVGRWSDLEPLLKKMYPLLSKRRQVQADKLLNDPPMDFPKRAALRKIDLDKIIEMKNSGLTQAEVSRKTGWSQPYISRLLNEKRGNRVAYT